MIRIAVCDDENVIVNQIEHIISEVCKRESIPVNIDVFYSGRELKRQVTSGTKYDIIFLDIQMKGGDGITAAENIRKVDDNVLLIYVSGYDKYMMELFRLDVFGFIKKPIDEEILTKTFLETYQRVCSKMVYFTFSYKHEEYKILCKEILYFESNVRKVTIYTQNGEHYTFNGKLSEIEQKMSDGKIPFLRVHQSYLVNCKYIKNTSYNHVELMDGAVLPVSQSKRKNIYNIFGKYRKITEDSDY